METNSLSWWHVIAFVMIVMTCMWLAKRNQSKIMVWLSCLLMICVAGLRHGYIDTRGYRQWFEYINVSDVLSLDYLLNSDAKDKGFSVLTAILRLLTMNSQIYLFVLSFVTVGFLFWGIIKKVPDIQFGVFLFIMTGCYLDTMNGARQALVAAILFYYVPALLEQQKTIQYVLLVLLLSTIHASALVFIPIYFIAKKRAWSGYTLTLIAVCAIFYVFFNSGIGAAISELLEGSAYGEDYGKMLLNGNTSVNVVRIIIAAVPMCLALITKKYREDNVRYNIFFNMTLINFMMWIFASKVLYFYRLAMYFLPYMIVFLCWELYNLRNQKSYPFIKLAAVCCYAIYFVYSLQVMGNQFFVGYLKY